VKRVIVLAEGQTEEAFVKLVLAPHLATIDKWPEVTRICTRREGGRRTHRGGGGSYEQIRRDLRLLLRSRPDSVTTMLDYYALPRDFPGWGTLPAGSAAFARVAHLEAAFAADIGDERFIPNLVLHELEGLLFTSPRTIAEVLNASQIKELERIAKASPSPEEINDGPETHPSKRLKTLYPEYQKTLHGPQIAARIGLAAIRAKCHHFNEWLARIETA